MPAYRAPGGTWTSELTGATAGQASSWTVALRNADTGVVVQAATNTGVTEIDAPSGNYQKSFTVPVTVGVYRAEWINGTTKYLDDETVEVVTVIPSSVTGPSGSDLVTLAQVREFLDLSASDTGQDNKIQSLITRASAAIVRECEREFGPVTASATRRFRVRPETLLRGYYITDLAPYDLASVTSVHLHPETSSPVTLTQDFNYLLEPNAKPEGVYTHLRLYPTTPITTSTVFAQFGFAYLDIAGAWGFPTVPVDVQDVCIKVVRTWLRPETPALADYGADVAVAPPVSAYDLPLFAKRQLGRWKRRPNII